MKIEGNQIKTGNILDINNKLWKVTKTQHTQPGKGGAYIQTELKEIINGTKMNTRFRSSETIERAILEEKEYVYLYNTDEKYTFMENKTYEQIEIGKNIINDEQSKFLVENDTITIQFYNNYPVSIILAESISLRVVSTEAVVKGQTAASSYKPALLEGNIKTNVPQFIDIDDIVVISTYDSSYIEKSKK
mgnify:CR=1 FL=1